MHARYYSSTLSRFLSPDKVGSSQTSRPQSWNRYVYGSNNPLRFVDPNGLAVVNFTVLTHGPNYVKGPVTELGPENVYGGFNYNTNVQVQMEASDNLQEYNVQREAQILSGEVRNGDSGDKKEEPED